MLHLPQKKENNRLALLNYNIMELVRALERYHVIVIFSVFITLLIADSQKSGDSVLYGAIVGFLVYFFVEKPILKYIKNL